MRYALPPHALPTPGRTGAPRRTARVLLTTALAAGLVACGLTPAHAATAPLAAAAAATAASAATTLATATTTTPFAADRFDRTVSGGWGTSTLGGAWTVAGSTSLYSVAPGAGRQRIASGGTAAAYLPVSSTDTDVRVDVALTRPAGSGAAVYTSVLGREVVGAGDYRARLVVTNAGTLELRVGRGTTTLRSTRVTGLTYAAGTAMSVRTQVTGTAPTTIRAKVWKAGTTEPSAWQLAATDSTASLQAPGRIALSTYQSGSSTAITASYSRFTASPTVATLAPAAPAVPVATAPVETVAPAPAQPAASPTPYLLDRFDRTVSGGWGTSAVGGTWKTLGGTTGYSVASGGGRQTVGNGQTAATFLSGLSVKDADVRVDVALNRAAGRGAGVYTSILAREIPGAGDYRSRLVVGLDGVVELRVARGSTTLRSSIATGVTYAPHTRMSVRTQVFGTHPTTVRAKVWKAGTPEPFAWHVEATDSTAALQVPGRLTLSTFATSATTPVTATFSALSGAPTVPDKPNVPPTASFTSAAQGLAVRLDASASRDTDGEIVSYVWTHGDGFTSSGATADHVYAAAGTYPTTLTVTDDRGAVVTLNRSVTVSGTGTPVATPRQAWLHPFAPTSPWNTAIGSGARFESSTGARTVSLRTTKPVINRELWSIPVRHAKTTDPLVTLQSVRAGISYRIHIPADTVTTGGEDGHVTIVSPDGITSYDTFKLVKVTDTLWQAQAVTVVDLRTSGIWGGVRAAATPALAGLIRAHEVRDLKIPHALAIAVPNTVLKNGPVWPAKRQDSDGATVYSGQVPMGTLFAIPSSVDVDALAVSPEGKALAKALQNYGAYVVDRAGTGALYCELACDATATARMNADWKVLFGHMRAVTNSTESTVGGGGTPRVAAPAAF